MNQHDINLKFLRLERIKACLIQLIKFLRETRAAELILAAKELAFQTNEKEKRTAELVIANKKLVFQNKESEKRASELLIANKELEFQNQEKAIRALELTLANKELKKAEKSQREYIKALREMMYMTSHRLRQPVVQILGLSSLLDAETTPEELIEFTGLMKESAQGLDNFTRELTTFIYKEELKAESKNPISVNQFYIKGDNVQAHSPQYSISAPNNVTQP
jgi:signal transduction histidine kinase